MSLPNKLLTVQQAADLLGVSTKTLRRWDKAGRFVPQRTAGNQRRYLPSQLEEFKKKPSPSRSFSSLFSSLPKERYSPFPGQNIRLGLFIGVLIGVIAGLSLLTYAPVPDSLVLGKKVLNAETEVPDFVFNVNVPANFLDEVTFAKSISVGEITAGNVIYSLTAGSGISVTAGQKPTLANSGVLSLGGSTGALSLAAGSGISVSGLTITNAGIVSLTAGTGISVSGSTITNSDLGSSQNIFKTFSVLGQSDIIADSNTDTFTFAAGTGITLATDATNDKLTIAGIGADLNVSGWTDDGTVVRLTTATDNVGIGTTSPSTNLEVAGTAWLRGASATTGLYVNSSGYVGAGTTNPTVALDIFGSSLISGNLGIGSSLNVDGPAVLKGNIGLGNSANDAITFNGRLATGTAIAPINDLGADLGTINLRFNNLYVANINTSSSQSYVGQVKFTYPPTDTTYTESSVLINPTAPPASSALLGIGVAGFERARIDAEGDIILGYNGNISADTTDIPLTIYNHSTSLVAKVDTSGNAVFNGFISAGVGLTTPKITITTGAQNNYILHSDAAGNATWVAPDSSGIGETYNAGSGITLGSNRLFRLGGALSENTRLNIGATEVMYFSTGGNVGIGTTSPSYKLDISGNINNFLTYLGNGNTGASAGGLYVRVDGTGNLLTLNYAGSDVVTVSQSQATFNVPSSFTGSGDVSIANDLVFTDQIASFIKTDAPFTIDVGENFESNDLTLRTYNAGNIILESANLWVDGTNVGIGTTSPFATLHVIGTGIFSGNVGIGTTALSSYALNINGSLGISSTAPVTNLNADYLDGYHSTSFLQTGSGTPNFLAKWTASGILNNSLWYDNTTVLGTSANVGIGNTAPVTLFSVGSNPASPALAVTSGGNVGIGTTNPVATFHVAATAPFVITSAGQVGIGTTSPLGLLHVNAGDAVTGSLIIGGGRSNVVAIGEINAQLDFRSNDGSVNNTNQIGGRIASVTEFATGAYTGLAFYTFQQSRAINLQEAVRITNAGNVGIGTTNPVSKLAVAGTTGISWGPANAGVLNGLVTIGDSGASGGSLVVRTNSLQAVDPSGLGIDGTYTGDGQSIVNIKAYGVSSEGFGSVLTFSTTKNTVLYERMRINSSGNVGIGTTGPSQKLHIVSGAATAYVKLEGSNGITYFGNDDLGNASFQAGTANKSIYFYNSAGGAPLVTMLSTGNVGIGTTNPVQKLHVEGNCITGDSLLYTVSSNSNAGQDSSQFTVHSSQIEEIPIKDVKPGTEVYSLNEQINKIEPHKINKLLDMGVKPVFRLTTKDGKEIRTTGNHPYLVQLTNDELNSRIQLRETGSLEESYGLGQGSLSSVYEFSQTRELWSSGSTAQSSNLNTSQYSRGEREIREQGIYPVSLSSQRESIRSSSLSEVSGRTEIFNPSTGFSSDSTNPRDQQNALGINKLPQETNWAKVIYLQVGDKIAVSSSVCELSTVNCEPNTPDGVDRSSQIVDRSNSNFCEQRTVNCEPNVLWAEISSIEYVGYEQVYDIEVEGTHNFIANGIVAHNTYMSGNVGIGTTVPVAKLSFADATGDKIRFNGATSTNGYGIGINDYEMQFYVPDTAGGGLSGHFSFNKGGSLQPGGTNELMRIDKSGNVGIGTVSPKNKLDINGSLSVGATNPSSLPQTNMLYVSGNVGIGNTNPLFKLDVTGNANFTTSINVGTSGTFNTLGVTSTGLVTNLNADMLDSLHSTSFLQVGGTGFITGSGTPNFLPKFTASTVLDNSLLYDDGTILGTNANFGVGTTNPLYGLHINGTGLVSSAFGVGATSPSYGLNVSTSANITANLNVGATGYIGTLAIGATNPATPLAIGNLTSTVGIALVVDANGNVYKTESSRRVKDNIQDLNEDFKKILTLQPKSFTYKATGAPDIGYIAEDLDNLGLSNLVIYDNEGLPSAIKYDRISLYLLEIAKEQQEKIASLSAEINGSILGSTPTDVDNDIKLSENIVIDGTLNVLGQATFGEIGVTGKITTGLLIINGLDENGAASLSTLSGPLELQKNSLGNLEIMDGKVIVDTKGNLSVQGSVTAKKYNVNESDSLSASAGEGLILAGELETLIETTSASESSRIFVTAKQSAVPLAVSTQKEGSFKVIIEKILTKDLRFSWWVIN